MGKSLWGKISLLLFVYLLNSCIPQGFNSSNSGGVTPNPPTDPLPPAEDNSVPLLSTSSFSIEHLAFQSPELLQNKLSKLLDLPLNGAPLNTFVNKLDQLGAHDFSIGVREESAYVSERVFTLLSVLKPFCESTEFRSKFNLPTALSAFVEQAYGRSLQASDQDIFNSILNEASFSTQDKSLLLCLSVLSSGEFVLK